MTSKEIKIALAIKRQKKAGNVKLHGGVNSSIKAAEKLHKESLADGHKNKGGIHRQNAKGFKNIHAK